MDTLSMISVLACVLTALYFMAVRFISPLCGAHSSSRKMADQLVAQQLVSVLCSCTSAALGLLHYSQFWRTETTAAQRLGIHNVAPGFQSALQLTLVITAAKQLWNTVIGYKLNDLPAEMLLHHILVLGLCLVQERTKYGMPYGIFFIGIAELSSIPLGLTKVLTISEAATRWPRVNTVCRMSFAVAFLCTRVVMWLYFAAWFWLDNFNAWGKELVELKWAAVVHLFSNGILTALQLVWAAKICLGVRKTMKPFFASAVSSHA